MEMTPRENMVAILEGKQPEYYGDFMDAVRFVPDPIKAADVIPQDGKEHKDSWGTTCVWLPGSPGKHPKVTEENAVVKDVCEWRKQLSIPEYKGLDWSKAREKAESIDRSRYFVTFFSAQGIFERSHFLMGMENAFCSSYILSATSRAVAAPFSFRREYGIKGVHGAEGAGCVLLEFGSSR